jgi:type IV pilus assembly protein PilM
MKALFKPTTIGVDIGRRNISGVRLKRSKGRVHLDRYFLVDLEAERDRGGTPVEASQVLRAQVEIQKVRNSRVSSALKDSDVHGFLLELPEMPEKDLELAVLNELALRMRVSEEELSADFQIESSEPGPHGKLLKIRAYCSHLGKIRDHMKLLSEAGLRPYSIESEMQAAVEALRFNEYLGDADSCVVLSIGDSTTMAGFVVDGALVSTVIEQTGLGDITRALQQEFGLSRSEAEAIKVAYSFSDDADETTPQQKVQEDILFRIFQAIKDAIEAFQETHPGVGLSKAYLIGGGSGVPQMDAVLQSFFRLPTEVPNPFRKIEIFTGKGSAEGPPIGEVAPYLTTAVGLALRNVA